MKTRIIGVAAVMLAVASSSVFGGQGRDRSPRGGAGDGLEGRGVQAVLKQLQLSETQKQQVADILAQDREAQKDLITQQAQARLALFNAIHADQFDESAVRAAAQQVAAGEAELAVLRARIVSQVRAILTPEQLSLLAEVREEAQQRLEERLARGAAKAGDWIEAHRSK